MSPCIEWTAGRNKLGYGRKRVGKHIRYVHRLAWEEAHGPIPDGLIVRHDCDNPSCYNVEHLRLGTYADNNRDMAERGRNRRGVSHPNAKLNDEAVRLIRASSDPQEVIAKRLNVSQSVVSQIRRRLTWNQINVPKEVLE